MRTITWSLAAVALVGVVGLTRNDLTAPEIASRSARVLQPPNKPKGLDIDVDNEVDNKKSHAVSDFITKYQYAFTNPQTFPVIQDDDTPCYMRIQAAVNSLQIERKKDPVNGNGFIVGILDNPNNCKPRAFDLASDEKAVWIVKFNEDAEVKKPVTHRKGFGMTRVIVLGGTKADRRLTKNGKKVDWDLGQCGHAAHPTADGDNAMIFYEVDRCSLPESLGHDAAKVRKAGLERFDAVRLQGKKQRAAFMAAKAKTKAGSKAKAAPFWDDDPALWFACGGDCCYATILNSN